MAEAGPDLIRDLLTRARVIAVVGASADPWRASFGVSRYLRAAGYRIVPVNPHALGSTLEGEPFVADLAAVNGPIDIVDVFRRPDALPAVLDEAIAVGAGAVWTQLGVTHPDAAARAQAAGMPLVLDRCISVEHRRLGLPAVPFRAPAP